MDVNSFSDTQSKLILIELLFSITVSNDFKRQVTSSILINVVLLESNCQR